MNESRNGNVGRGEAGGIVLTPGDISIGRCVTCAGPIPRRAFQSDIAVTCSPKCASAKFHRDNPGWGWPRVIDVKNDDKKNDDE